MRLVLRGEKLLAAPYQRIRFTGNMDADILLNDLRRYPHAFVIACVMDRQSTAERAWLVPHLLRERLGTFKFAELAALEEGVMVNAMATPTPLHRFPQVMGRNAFLAIQRIGNDYAGRASKIWIGSPSSATLVRRFLEFDGIGPKIATMAANILVREFKVSVSDRVSIDVSPDVHVKRVFKRLGLIRPAASNEELIYRARELNPLFPGVVDLPAWEIGRNWCRPDSPLCADCYMSSVCPSARSTA
jgi:endonuclease III